MAWFSKSSADFFLSTVVPQGEGGARVGEYLGLVNIGDTKSLATHPASTTHRQLSPEELAKTGVKEETVRLCIGIEHIDDLLADLDQALAKV